MSITLPKFEFDVFGNKPANYIKNEKVLIAENCVWLIPDGAPFFTKDVVISTPEGGIVSPSKYKLRGHQYFLDVTAKSGKKVAGFIEVTDPDVLKNNTHLLMTYRTVGSYYVPRNKIMDWLEEIKNGKKGFSYDRILHLPDIFPWNYHIHSAKTEVGDYYELTDFFKMLVGSRLLLDNTVGPMIDAEFKAAHDRLAGYRDAWHAAIRNHRGNYNNAHGVNKAMLGLNLLENYKTASLSEEVLGGSSSLFSTPLGVRTMVISNVANNVSFLENGVFPISYLKGFSATASVRVLNIANGCTALINGTLYAMPSGAINFDDYVGPGPYTLYLAATVHNGVAVWDVLNTTTNEADNFCLIAAKVRVTTGAIVVIETYTPFLIANHEVTDTLSKPGCIIHSSGLPMDEGVYRIQEKYIQDDPYTQ